MIKDAYSLRDYKPGLGGGSGSSGDQDKGWYKSWPYAFVANIDDTQKVFYLPISPQNLNITTNFATNLIATLHSTVEEHSEVRYYDITIQGTTGFASAFGVAHNFIKPMNLLTSINKRQSYGGGVLSDLGAGGFMRRTVALAQAAANSAADMLIPRTHETGVFTNNNGYVAFHNFYRFLLKYKESTVNKTKKTSTEPLLFLNYKDNNQYSCVIQRFVLERSAENPMLYNYSIQMRAYNLKTISKRFSDEGGLTDRYALLGLTGTSKSIAAKIADKVRLAKNGINAARNLIGSVGR